jgi:hypothetical protein
LPFSGIAAAVIRNPSDEVKNMTTGSKHTTTAIATCPAAAPDACLPCGCTPYLSDGNPNTLHVAGCKMNLKIADRKAVIRQRPAVIAMFTQLNELWYLSHVHFVPDGTKRCDRPAPLRRTERN